MNLILAEMEWKVFSGWTIVLIFSAMWLAIAMINQKNP
jgi:hypothetical protein